jgi:hypothetical protein
MKPTGLRYVNENEPRLTLVRSGAGFSPRRPGGRLVRDKRVCDRIRRLAGHSPGLDRRMGLR